MKAMLDIAELFDTGQLKFHAECKQWGVLLVRNPGWEDVEVDYVHFCLNCTSYVIDPTKIVSKDRFQW